MLPETDMNGYADKLLMLSNREGLSTKCFLLISLTIFMMHVLSAVGLCNKQISIATDNNYWYPYTYEENGESKGMHVDIVQKALSQNGLQAVFVPLPWKRCLKEAETGHYNAVVSASYKPDRAKSFFYPADASSAFQSKWRITQAEYVVISSIHDSFSFTGDLLGLPCPVRVPLGYSIGDDLKKNKIKIQTGTSTYKLMADLIRLQKGVFITPKMNAMALQNQSEFQNQIKIQKTPIASKSYFIVFSKINPQLSQIKIQKIWDSVAHLREDETFMSALYAKYYPVGK